MEQFVAGVPVVTFINSQTQEKVKMMFAMDYNKFIDEIVIGYATTCYEEYQTVFNWIANENFVKLELKFNTYIGDAEDVTSPRVGFHIETYPVIMVYRPFVRTSNNESAGIIEFKIKVRE